MLSETDLITIDARTRENDDNQRNQESQSSDSSSPDLASGSERSETIARPSRDQSCTPPSPPPLQSNFTDAPCDHRKAEPMPGYLGVRFCPTPCGRAIDDITGKVLPFPEVRKRRDPATMATVTCSRDDCDTQWQVLPADVHDGMLCTIHTALLKQQQARERQRDQRAKRRA